MGVVIPQVVTEDRASEAQFIDGSLRFDRSKTHILRNTFSSVGNRKTWTLSFWHKITDTSNSYNIFTASRGSSTRPTFEVAHNYGSSSNLVLSQYNGSGYDIGVKVDGLYRDIGAWYHFLVVVDTTQSTDSNRVKAYVNGVQRTVTATAGGSVWPSLNADLEIGNNVLHNISANAFGDGNPMNGYVSNFYYINGQALEPSSFGYTDPLTNTWRPKRYTGTYGTNGFYLPMDGNTPIGQDRSGNNNNWTPVNFGGSNTLEKATGALPILNTDGGGKVARVGVRTDSNASSLVLALPLVGASSDFSNAINSGTSNKAITSNNSAASSSAQSNFYGGSFYFNGTNQYLTSGPSSDFSMGTGDFTVEGWIYKPAFESSDPGFWTIGPNLLGTNTPGYSNSIGMGAFSVSNDIAVWNNNNYSLTGITNKYAVWYHFANVRRSGVQYLFIDGVLVWSIADTTNYTGTYLAIGAAYGSNYCGESYIQDFRIYKGLAKYTQNFIPASTDPDILPDTPSGVAYSSNVSLVPSTDGGAVAFDGSGDYLSLASSADFAFGTGDFTIEAFCYKQSGKMFVLFDHLMGIGNFTIFAYADDVIQVYNNQFLSSGANPGNNKWFHLAVVRQSGVLSFYIDGIKAPTTHTFTYNFTTAGANIGVTQYGEYSTGFISNLHIVKGTALYTSNFTPPTAPITSVANTKLLCCKSQTSATAFDVSPGTITANGNAAATNFNPFTVNINTQRGQESGYCTWNPLAGNTYSASYKNGNLTFDTNGIAADGLHVFSTYQLPASGKWYWETTFSLGVGFPGINSNITKGDNTQLSTMKVYNSNGEIGGVAGSSTWTTGDVIGMAYDADAGTLRFYKNGILQPTSISSVGSSSGPWWAQVRQDRTATCNTTFGQKPFKFPPPAGFQPLALANTPRPSIVRPDQYVGIVTYTGNGSTLTVNTGFQPDLVWCKIRSPNAYNHTILDSVRGFTKSLSSSMTVQEYTEPTGPVAIIRNGFTLNGDVTYVGSVNQNGSSYVAWAWKAGGNSNTYNINDVGYATASAAGLTAGTITPTGASVNTKSGFSIITYTGNGTSGTLSHGLGNAPAMVIIKSRSDGTTNWIVWHKGLTSGYYILLSSSGAQTNTSASQYFGNTSTTVDPSSTVITLGGANAVNNSSPATYVAYSWAEIPGFSKFGTYTGNGSTDGVTVVTGFRPAVVLMKKTSGISNWFMHDSGRNRYNAMTSILFSNLADQEDNTYGYIDFLSNGFKLRFQNTDYNTGSATYIYAAFAETPSFNLYGGQANAR